MLTQVKIKFFFLPNCNLSINPKNKNESETKDETKDENQSEKRQDQSECGILPMTTRLLSPRDLGF